MPVNAGSVTPPRMELTFRVALARGTKTPSAGLNVGATMVWSLFTPVLQADIAPLKDDLLFMQTGTENIATHVYHFYANTDVRPNDRIFVLSSRRLAGPIGSWFDLTSVVEPTETLAFVRAYGRLTDKPPGISNPAAPAV